MNIPKKNQPILIGAAVIGLITAVISFQNSYAQYAASYVGCGFHQPYVVSSSSVAGETTVYDSPKSGEYFLHGLNFFTHRTYYCHLSEVQQLDIQPSLAEGYRIQ